MDRLLAAGYEVIGVDSLFTGSAQGLTAEDIRSNTVTIR